MAQHFLLSSAARSLSMMKLYSMSDDEAFEVFKTVRWYNTNGVPVCPKCGTVGSYFIKSRKQFRCRDLQCNHTFSVTSGTIFASNKKPLKIYLIAIALFVNSVKGISALQLSRELEVQYKTAWVLAHKIRESLMNHKDDSKLSGTCEIDGVYVGNYIRPKNFIHNRIDRRKVYKKNKRTIISIRQRVPIESDLKGAIRTKTFVTKGEDFEQIKDIVYENVEIGTEIHSDEHIGYDPFIAHYDLKRVNHSEEYCSVYGDNNNQCESYNARFRRLMKGQCHRLSVLYLSNYANEIAYREDTRRMDNKAIFDDILSKCLGSPVSNEFCGYWQGNKRVVERLGV